MTQDAWSLFVVGEPKSTQTGTVMRLPDGRRIPKRRNSAWSATIGYAANQTRPPQLLVGALRVALTFYRTRPGSSKRAVYPIARPDLGNLSKGLLDVLEGIVYATDAAVTDLVERKRFADERPDGRPGVQITVTPLEELPPPKPAKRAPAQLALEASGA